MPPENLGQPPDTVPHHKNDPRHELEIQNHFRAWDRKPVLREIYHDFYRIIAGRLAEGIRGPVVEIGSGMGRIKDIIPDCITTDLSPYRWLDRQENAYALSFEAASISHLVLLDVWHHLRYPGAALAEFRRVLTPGGSVILFEPAISWIGRVVYGLLHHEPVAIRNPIEWDAPKGFDPWVPHYYAAQGNATRLFWWREAGTRGEIAAGRVRRARRRRVSDARDSLPDHARGAWFGGGFAELAADRVGDFVHLHRLRDVVVHAGGDAEFAVALHRVGGERDDFGLTFGREARADLPARFEAVHLRHLEIHQN